MKAIADPKINQSDFQEFLEFKKLKDRGITIADLKGSNLQTLLLFDTLSNDVNHQEEGGLCMKGAIRTKEKCPVCGGKFINTDQLCEGKFVNTNQLIVCPECFEKRKISMPTRFYLDLFWNGKQRKIYSDNDGRVLNNYELANRVLIEIRQKIDKHRFDPKDYVAKNYIALQFDKYAEKCLKRYIELYEQGEKAFNTIEKLKSNIQRHYIPFFRDKDIRDLKTGEIEDFYLSLPKKLKLSSKKTIMNYLHMIFSYAKRRRDIKEAPQFPQIQLEEYQTKWADEETQDLIYKHIPDHHKPIFLFMMRQAVRPSESRALHWEDIDWTNRTATIQRSFSYREYQEKTKTKNIRTLPLDEDVYNDLLKRRGIKGFVFTNKGNPYTYPPYLNEIWNKAVKEAGLEPITLYAGTRHSVASQAANRGVQDNKLQTFLGHTNPNTTHRYTHINTEGIKVVLRQKSKVLKMKIKKNGT